MCTCEQEPDWVEYHQLKKALKILLDTLPQTERQVVLNGGTPDNVSCQSKLQQVEINLERWRQEKEIPGDRYLLVNIPAFRLYYMRADTVFFSSKIIVGAIDRQTPVLSSKLECLTLYPYWYVPRKIAVEEYLPVIKRDSMFLYRNNFDVLNREGEILNPASIPWQRYTENNFPVTLRQREGSVNALGLVKFVFDNPYQVYLHDTNARGLFNNEYRALSHGCVRVEHAITLAHLLLTGRPKQKSVIVDRYIQKKERRTVSLPESIPIHIRYVTAEFREGIFYSYQDVYREDESLIRTFYQL